MELVSDIGYVTVNNRTLRWGKFICPTCSDVLLRPMCRGRAMKRCPNCSSEHRKSVIRKHSGRNTRLYRTWTNMKSRCLTETDFNYSRYGGRGISICEEWLDFATFRLWALSNGYTDDLTIDRVNVDGDYVPSNCRWVTTKVNASKDKIKLQDSDIIDIQHRVRLGQNLKDVCSEYKISTPTYYRGIKRLQSNPNEV